MLGMSIPRVVFEGHGQSNKNFCCLPLSSGWSPLLSTRRCTPPDKPRCDQPFFLLSTRSSLFMPVFLLLCSSCQFCTSDWSYRITCPLSSGHVHHAPCRSHIVGLVERRLCCCSSGGRGGSSVIVRRRRRRRGLATQLSYDRLHLHGSGW